MSEIPIPSAAPIKVSPHLTIQPPLSRRGSGQGLILVLDHYARLEKSEKHVDPPPLTKWAEEGFAVAQILVPGKPEDGGEFPLDMAIRKLTELDSCEHEQGFGLISYVSRIPFYVEEAASLSPHIKAIISYGGKGFASVSQSQSIPPTLIHCAGPDRPRRESRSVIPELDALSIHSGGIVKTHRYVDAKEGGWALPGDEGYHAPSASLAHTRSLSFLKPLLNGPYFDLEAIWEEHCKYEFGDRHVEDTMATMVAEPYVNHIPTMTGGIGKERLTAFYTHHFIFSNPEDTKLQLVSRTVGIDRVVDEFVFSFTHDKVVDWLLPGVPPTGKHLQISFVSVVALRGDRLCHEHIHWDQATALLQAGLLPEWTQFPYPVDGKEPAAGTRFEVRLPTVGIEAAQKLVEEGSVESNSLIEREGGKGWREVDDK